MHEPFHMIDPRHFTGAENSAVKPNIRIGSRLDDDVSVQGVV